MFTSIPLHAFAWSLLEVLKMNQRYVWGSVAESWERFRKKPMKEVIEFLNGFDDNVLDLGCGNGRNFIKMNDRAVNGAASFSNAKNIAPSETGVPRPKINKTVFGIDFSEKLLRYAKSNAEKQKIRACLIKADISELPLKDNSFNIVVFTSALHCLKKSDRKKCLEELKRVLKNKGRALITVWNRMQPRFFFGKKERHIPWKIGNKTFMRYYYLFSKRELRKVLEEHGFRIIKISGSKNKVFKLFPKNIIAVIEK